MTYDEKLLESVAARAVNEGLADGIFTRLDTPIGRLIVLRTTAGVARVAFPKEPEDKVLREAADILGPRIVASRSETKDIGDRLLAYLEGDPVELLDMPVDLSLVHSPFRRKVLQRLIRVPRGKVVTYRHLATSAGKPRAARAVGTACATNPIPLIVPCHRVVPSAGGVGKYGGGPELKKWLLELEGFLNG